MVVWDRWRWHPHVRSGGQLKVSERAADAAQRALGSWPYIFAQTIGTAAWMILNVVAWCYHWDPRPWIMLNLIFSIQAAYATPLLLLAGRRKDQKDSEDSRFKSVVLMMMAERAGIGHDEIHARLGQDCPIHQDAPLHGS